MKQKAWIINTSNFNEPWFAPTDVFYGDTRNEARTEALNHIRHDNFTDKDDEPIGLLNIRMQRLKGADKILVDGVYKTVADIEYEKQKKEFNEKLDNLIIDNPNGYAYVRKGGSYYRPNSCGYTEFITRAGVYPIKEAVAEVRGCSLSDRMDVILIDIEAHNATLTKEIESLQSRLINVKTTSLTTIE